MPPFRFQKPVAQVKPPAHYEGDVCEADACRAKHPAYGWGWFAVGEDGPDFDKPVRWVEENPEDADDDSGKWEFAKDVS